MWGYTTSILSYALEPVEYVLWVEDSLVRREGLVLVVTDDDVTAALEELVLGLGVCGTGEEVTTGRRDVEVGRDVVVVVVVVGDVVVVVVVGVVAI